MPVRVAVVGAGVMGSNHLRVLSQFDEQRVEIVGVAESDHGALTRAVRQFHIPGFGDYAEMIASIRPDLVVVAVPTALHFEVASFAADHEAHVLVEKPITRTIEEAVALRDRGREKGVHIAVGYVERFNPAVRALKQRLDAGTLGQIFALHSFRLGPFPPRIRDVGVILDLATHDLDVMRYLMQEDVTEVFAKSRCVVHSEYEDLFHGMISFAGQTVGALDVNWLTPTKVRELRVTGEHGMYLLNYLSQELYFYENDHLGTTWDAQRTFSGVSEGAMTRLKVLRAEPLRLEYEDVLDAITQDREPTVTARDGVAVLQLAHLLLKSSRSGMVVPAPSELALVPALV